jgi:hypothetical protein
MVLSAPPAQAAVPLFTSDSVTQVTTLPDAVGAIGARFSPDGRTMYVTSGTGSGIYDGGRPAARRLLGRLPLPRFENEDVDVGRVAGRDLVVITDDTLRRDGSGRPHPLFGYACQLPVRT